MNIYNKNKTKFINTNIENPYNALEQTNSLK